MCTWLHGPLKLLTSTFFAIYVPIQISHDGFIKTYMHVPGLWFANIAAVKIIIKHIRQLICHSIDSVWDIDCINSGVTVWFCTQNDDRSVDPF